MKGAGLGGLGWDPQYQGDRPTALPGVGRVAALRNALNPKPHPFPNENHDPSSRVLLPYVLQGYTLIMENQMEKKMENEMETGIIG